MRLAILLMCHESPGAIAARLGSAFYRSPDVKVYLHHDLGSRHRDRAAFEAAIPAHVQWQWLSDAVRARWGEYALVEATLRLMEAALRDTAFGADHLILLSGSCRPIRPLASLQAYLAERPATDFIQAHDISVSRWTKGGLEQERFEYFFPFNFQTHRWWFERTTALQRRLRVRRRLPAGLKPHFGSQWFCLRRDTAMAVVELLRRPELARFFATTWIPDEFVIQTAVATLRPRSEIAGHGLTYYEFDGLGKPLVLEDWHLDHLRRQPFFFARKISPDATRLEREFDAIVSMPEPDLHYFANVGNPTPEFERHLASARTDPGRRSRVGSFPIEVGGPMAVNRRRYYVVVGSSRARVARLLALARAIGAAIDAPIFDFPFDRSGLHLAQDRLHWRGLGPDDRLRVRYDPCAVLHELVQIDPRQCIAFGLDLSTWCWVRDFVAIDPNAILVDCDPPGLTRIQRAARGLRLAGGTYENWMREPTLEALRRGSPLPQDFFNVRRALGKTRCTFIRPTDLDFANDTTWQALTAAAAALGSDAAMLPQAAAAAIVDREE